MWLSFSWEKASALIDDLQPSTHPIDAPCKDNEEAQGLLDGITYGKGAVYLNQIISTIGEHRFFKGCKKYFKKHEWSNTELKDFIACLQEELKSEQLEADDPLQDFDLNSFTEIWLKNSGCNKIVSQLEFSKDELNVTCSKIKIIQLYNYETDKLLYRP